MTITEVELVPVYPPFVMDCAETPNLPTVITGQAVGEWVLRVDVAYNDCKSVVKRVQEWVEKQKKSCGDD